MKEQALKLDAPMVQAILEGRKTQLRRPVKETYYRGGNRIVHLQDEKSFYDVQNGCIYLDASKKGIPCSLGKPGDRLWVRETLKQGLMIGLFGEPTNAIVAQYEDGESVCNEHGFDLYPWWKGKGGLTAIRMPRWASRLTLEITDIRVQRLQDISNSDAIEEGMGVWLEHNPRPGRDGNPDEYREAFREFWEASEGVKYPWSSNPWVWAVEFASTLKG